MSADGLRRLLAAGVDNATHEWRWLQEASTDPAWLADAVERRCGGEPLAYILGEWEFYGLPFRVSPAVLIPRPETEMLVDSALALDTVEPLRRVVDVATGSGCVAVSIAVKCPTVEVLATDISPDALAVARANAQHHGVADRIHFAEGDLCDPVLAYGWEGTVDVLTANLPYVEEAAAPTLQHEVLREPPVALFAGPDGLTLLRRLVPQVPTVLRPGGSVLLEVGLNQAARVVDLLGEAGCDRPQTQPDWAGIPRLVSANRPFGH